MKIEEGLNPKHQLFLCLKGSEIPLTGVMLSILLKSNKKLLN